MLKFILSLLLLIDVAFSAKVIDQFVINQDSNIYSDSTFQSSKVASLKKGNTVKVTCQLVNKESNETSVWSKVAYGDVQGYVPYAHMLKEEEWIPGAPNCACRSHGIPPLSDAKVNHDDAYRTLNKAKIGVSNLCITEGKDCTYLGGLRNDTLQGLVSFVSTTQCKDVLVIGGTEIRKSESIYSHKNGFR
ncbi:hypothetical protein K7432_017015, partial [Basidiobolus ranarum]